MKRLSGIVLLFLMFSFLIFVPARADEADDVANAMFAFQAQVDVDTRDMDALMTEVLHRYPALGYYYSGYNAMPTGKGYSVTFYYANEDVALDSIYVVSNFDQMVGAMGLAMSQGQEMLHVVLQPEYNQELMGREDYWEDATAAFQKLENDYYMIYMGYSRWFGNSKYITLNEDETIGNMTIELYRWEDLDKDQMMLWRNLVEDKVTDFMLTQVAQDMPDGLKEIIIHNYLVDNNYYDPREAFNDVFDYAQNHTAYGAFVGMTVCQGYCAATHLLLQACGIEDLMVRGDAGGPHVWNEVLIDGDWYLLDVTWDDPISTDGSDYLLYDYYNQPDSVFAMDHEAYEDIKYPAYFPPCTSTAVTAEDCLALLDAGTDMYTDYSTDLVETQAKDILALQALYGGAPAATVEETASEPIEEEMQVEETPVEEAVVEESSDDTTEDQDTTTLAGDDDATLPVEDADTSDDTLQQKLADIDLDALFDDDDDDSLVIAKPGKITVDQDDQTQTNQNPIQWNVKTPWAMLILLAVCFVIGGVTVWIIQERRVALARAERETYRNEKLASMKRDAGRHTRRF